MNLQDVFIFVRVVDTGSFAAAARELGLSCPAVSRHVSRLEDDLGVQLLRRSTRRLSLSESGLRFYERARSSVAELAAAGQEAVATNAELKGNLRVMSDLGVGQHLIGPAISEFVKRHPQVSIDLTLGSAEPTALSEGFDIVVIDRARATGPNLETRHLVDVRYVVCASPKYIRQAGAPSDPRDLARHNCIVNPSRTVDSEWRFRRASKEIRVRVTGSIRSNDGGAIVDAVLDGAGIAHLPNYAVADDIRRKRLAVLFQNVVIEPRVIVACTLSNPHPPARQITFIDFLEDFSGRWVHIEPDSAKKKVPAVR